MILTYHRPTDLPSAQVALQQADTLPLTLGPRVPLDLFETSRTALDLSALNLNYIRAEVDGAHIGALTPLQTVAESNAVNVLVRNAIQITAHLGLRHLAVLGASLAAPDIAVALLALNAQVISGEARRATALADYQPSAKDLLIEILIPPFNGKIGAARIARTPRDEAILCAAATITDSLTCIAIAGASPLPLVASGSSAQDVIAALTAQANPVGDYRASAEYRKAMVAVLAKRAVNSNQ